jgi:hypothetical protein
MDNENNITDKNNYVSFDATSISDLIIKRLNQSEVFTDQNFQGSNLSSFLDVISYTFSTLLYYLNKTSSESMFSEAQIYENMNRIVKILNYNPRGKMSQSVNYNINASLPVNENYVIPRYSYIRIGSLYFSFPKDIYFSYLNNSVLNVQNAETDLFLFEGKFSEYPIYKALGAMNEVLFLNFNNTISIDHNLIDVYVRRNNTTTWEKWERTENLFLNRSNDNVYEVRYNPNKNYEIKFGDNICGKQLNTGDEVCVYYLQISDIANTISSNSLKQSKIVLFNGLNFKTIFEDTLKYNAKVLNNTDIEKIIINNEYPSTVPLSEETVEDIRKNAPKHFSYQNRLITPDDFKNYIQSKYSNIFSDCYIVNNEEYLKGHLKYLYNIGIKSPQLNDNILFNQIKFSNSCNFNNIYVYMCPLNGTQKYISNAQKEIILNDLENQKPITSQIIPMDPVYMLFDFYVKPNTLNNPDINELPNCFLKIYKKSNTRISDVGIINSVIEIFKKYFSNNNVKFGQMIDINKISSDIISLEGVEKIQTYRQDLDLYVDGLCLLMWNKNFPNLDTKVNTSNVKLEYFQYPNFNNIDTIINKIKIINSSGVISLTNY